MRVIAFALWFWAAVCSAAPLERTIQVGEDARRFLELPPAGSSKGVVIALHGGGSKPEWARWRTGNFGLEDWRIIYPAAIGGRRWNDGRLRTDGEPLATSPDVAFLRALVGLLIKEGADAQRVFIAGVSNGGMMTLRMICAAPDLFAGAAVVIGNHPEGVDCPTLRALPMIFFHGMNDTVTPYRGGAVAKDSVNLGRILSADATLAMAAKRNSCIGYAERPLDVVADTDPTRVRARIYNGCAAPLHHYIVEGGGHAWPGTPYDAANEERFGPTTLQIDATALIAGFFEDLAAGHRIATR